MNKKITIFLLLIIFFTMPKTFSTEPLPEPVYFNEYIIKDGENVSIQAQTRTIHIKPIDGFSNSEYITHAQVTMNHQIMNHTANDIETRLAMVFETPFSNQYISQFRFMKDDVELPFKMYHYYSVDNELLDFFHNPDSSYTFDGIFNPSNEIDLDADHLYSEHYGNRVYFVFDVILSSGINHISHFSISPLRKDYQYFGENPSFGMMFHHGTRFKERSDIVIDILYDEAKPYYIIYILQQYESIENGYRFIVDENAYFHVTLNTTGNAIKTIHPLIFIMMGIAAVIIGITVAPIVIILIVNKNKK